MIPAPCDKPLTGLDWLEWYAPHKVFHPAIDINHGYGNDDLGTPVKAARAGYIQYSHDNVATSGGFGKFVIILHADSSYTRYAHLADIVSKADPYVQEGDVIGHVGNTGTTYAHLHFEVFNQKLAAIQKTHWKPWRYYPSGKTKAWVQEHYLNPWTWLETPQEKTDLEKGYDFLKDNGYVKSSLPKDVVTVDMLGTILQRMKHN